MPTSTISAQEKKAGQAAARKLRSGLKSKATSVFDRLSGKLAKSTATARMKRGRLQRIAIVSPYYGFIQNYGFEKKKSNGVFQRLEATGWIANSIEESKSIENLASEISEIRGGEVVAQFKILGKNAK